MKEIGNLAIVAAKQKDCLLQIYNEKVSIHIGEGPERSILSCEVWDDESIKHLIAFLNFKTEVPKDARICCTRQKNAYEHCIVS